MAIAKKTKVVASDHLIARAAARLSRLNPVQRDAYIARAQKDSKSKHPTRNAQAVAEAAGK